MPQSHQPSRRSALKLLAAAPMLPLSTLSAGALLSGCATSGGAASGAAFASAAFTGMAPPSLANAAAMATTTVASSLQVTLQDGSSRAFKLAYQPFFMTGDQVPDGNGGTTLAGAYVDIFNRPIIDKSVPGKERQFFSDCPDGTSLLQLPKASVKGVKGNTVFAVVQFEYTNTDLSGADTYGTLPSPIAVLTLDQDPATGKLTLVKYHNVDTSQAQGLWITCGASLSPWGTHLSSEEYEPDARFHFSSNAQFSRPTARTLVRQMRPRCQPLPLRPSAGNHRQRLTAPATVEEALLPGPHLARAGAGHARQPHRADG